MKSQDEKPIPGALVVLTKIPPELLHGLPTEDKQAISEVAGKLVLLNAYDDEGRSELQFTDSQGIVHLFG